MLFYSPTWPHCRVVISEGLPPIVERFGDGLRLAHVDVLQEGGRQLYIAAMQRFAVPQEGWGVPALVVGSRLLMGADAIPAELPGLVEAALAEGGVSWPDVPGLFSAGLTFLEPFVIG